MKQGIVKMGRVVTNGNGLPVLRLTVPAKFKLHHLEGRYFQVELTMEGLLYKLLPETEPEPEPEPRPDWADG